MAQEPALSRGRYSPSRWDIVVRRSHPLASSRAACGRGASTASAGSPVHHRKAVIRVFASAPQLMRVVATVAVVVAAAVALAPTLVAAENVAGLRGSGSVSGGSAVDGSPAAAAFGASHGLVDQSSSERKREHHQGHHRGGEHGHHGVGDSGATTDDARFAVATLESQARMTGIECAMAASVAINVATTVTKAVVSCAACDAPWQRRPRQRHAAPHAHVATVPAPLHRRPR